jgi:hypothetical protein
MTVVATELRRSVDLTGFRRRIRALRAWRLGAVGGAIGAAAGIIALIGDWFGVVDMNPAKLGALVAIGVSAGAIRAAVERYSDLQIARSIDRRSAFDDRLTTLYDIDARHSAEEFREAVEADAMSRMENLSPASLYPFRASRWHWLFVSFAAACCLLYLAIDTPLFRSAAAKSEAVQLSHTAAQVTQIARPVLEQAKKADATDEDKALARDLQRFTHDLSKARMSKQEALIRANQLAEQAQKLQATKSAALASSLDKAQTAGERLQQMADKAKLEKSDAAKLADKERGLEQQIADAKQRLAASRTGSSHMSASEQKALEQKIGDMEKALHTLRLSREAQEMMSKLAAMPEFQQAQELLKKLQEESQAEQDGEPSRLTPDDMRRMADQLDQLAKQLNTDEKLKEYAQALLDAAKQARQGQAGNAASKLLGAFGLGGQGMSAGTQSSGGTSDGGSKGNGVPSKDIWTGDHGALNKADKSSLLNVKFQDRVITSQKGKTGPETYSETLGPSQLGAKSGVPYQALLPKYEKSAESALSKGNIPPQMRTQVRDYFSSLH